ncbi:hypothetical protein GH714_033862 [Hevea brasiliensis]|uniref:C-JID domain-containing protein n=1 Tax=Hevea brasiliensis TaxID=3981 RepID=A0A6A6NCE8_HEVBR|nr:hypothetical protein GH714_033862 [Hevea brasiliensis]
MWKVRNCLCNGEESPGVNTLGLPRPTNCFDVCLPGSEIPEWFINQSMGSSVSIDLLPHWNDSDLMGFAMCAIFRLRRLASFNYRRFDYHRPKNVVLACFFVNDEGEFLFNNHARAWFPTCSLVKNCAQIGSDHLWLLFRRSYLIKDALNELNRIKVSFRGLPGSDWDLEIWKCAVRLVYSQDLEELNQTIISNSLNEDLDILCDDFDSSRNGSTGQNFNDSEPGGSRNSTEEEQPKKLGKI